jgi:hypothetical protein
MKRERESGGLLAENKEEKEIEREREEEWRMLGHRKEKEKKKKMLWKIIIHTIESAIWKVKCSHLATTPPWLLSQQSEWKSRGWLKIVIEKTSNEIKVLQAYLTFLLLLVAVFYYYKLEENSHDA